MSAEDDMCDHIVACVDKQIHGCEKFVTDKKTMSLQLAQHQNLMKF